MNLEKAAKLTEQYKKFFDDFNKRMGVLEVKAQDDHNILLKNHAKLEKIKDFIQCFDQLN